jgi:hypothetical protein
MPLVVKKKNFKSLIIRVPLMFFGKNDPFWVSVLVADPSAYATGIPYDFFIGALPMQD